jgi:hypothetical protein
MVHPSIVVGLVSGTGAGLVEIFVRSTAGGCGALVVCFVMEDFEVSCVLLVAVAMGFADETCTSGRPDLAASSGSAEPILTGSDAGLTKNSELKPSNHPKQRTRSAILKFESYQAALSSL